MSNISIPNEILLSFQRSLLGEVYPQIRAIAVSFEENSKLLIRYYLDREPTDYDIESIEVLADNVLSDLEPNVVSSIQQECIYSNALIKNLDPLLRFVYVRREY
jgi:hypothetical protein